MVPRAFVTVLALAALAAVAARPALGTDESAARVIVVVDPKRAARYADQAFQIVAGTMPGNPRRQKIPSLVQKALKLDQGNARAFAAMAWYLKDVGDFTGCITHTRQAIEFEADDGFRQLQASRGAKCADAIDDATAAAEFWAIVIPSEAHRSMPGLARALAKLNRSDEAVSAYENAVRHFEDPQLQNSKWLVQGLFHEYNTYRQSIGLPFISLAAVMAGQTPKLAAAPMPGCISRPNLRRWVLHFGPQGTTFNATVLEVIDYFVTDYRSTGKTRVWVDAFTDTEGPAEANLALSNQRAESTKNALIARGISAAQISAGGFGEAHPTIQTADEVREPMNNRVEVCSQ